MGFVSTRPEMPERRMPNVIELAGLESAVELLQLCWGGTIHVQDPSRDPLDILLTPDWLIECGWYPAWQLLFWARVSVFSA
jgi:hypothetical protein